MSWPSIVAVQTLLLLAHTVRAFTATVVQAAADEYDYVIVGGGTSGLVVANRLSEDAGTTVLVIEAGPILNGKEEFDELLVQAIFEKIDRTRSAHTWPNITTGPIDGLNGRSHPVLTAKIAGGGSAVNGKIFVRGSRRDYDDWARYLDDDGWGWKSLLEYFKKSETFTPPTEPYRQQGNITWDMSVHGTNGPIQATYPQQFYPSTKYLVAAEKGLGIPLKNDQADGDPVGAIWHPATIHPGEYTRSYSKRDHFDPAKAVRPNLHLLAETTATKVLFTGKTAARVEYAADSDPARLQTVKVNREVIVAGGAIKTPQFLQVSGVGPRKLLDAIGVTCISDLPVGENLHDHGVFTLDYKTMVTFEEQMWAEKQNKTFMDEQYAQFITNHTGYYTTTSSQHMALLSVPMLHSTNATSLLSHFQSQDPTQYLRPGTSATSAAAYLRQHTLLLASMATNDTAVDENYTGGKASILVKPLSRGFVEATDPNIRAPPRVNHRTFSHPLDLANALASLRLSRRLLNAPEMAPLRPVEVAPGPAVQADGELEAWIRENMTPGGAHMCCSAPMGTVLDARMRVRGVRGVRVVDAAAWPMIPGGHATQCTAYAVAERAADLIRADAGGV